MKKVFLYGELKRRFCRSLEVDVSDTTELMHALDGNFPGFIQYIIKSHVEGVDYSLTKKDPKKIESKKDFENHSIIEDSDNVLGKKNQEIHIIPIVQGAFIFNFFSVTLALGTGMAAKIATAVTWAAITQVAMNVLFKPPKQKVPKVVSTRSMILNTKGNSRNQGIPVPVGYGRLRVGAANIVTHQENRMKEQKGDTVDRKLESVSDVFFLDLISEGPVKGLADEYGYLCYEAGSGSKNESDEILKGIYINEVPVKNHSGFRNYILNEAQEGQTLFVPDIKSGSDFSRQEETRPILGFTSNNKSYDIKMIGGSPEGLTDNSIEANRKIRASTACAFLDVNTAIDQTAKPFPYRVSNKEINELTFSFKSTQSYTPEGDTLQRNIYFAITYQIGGQGNESEQTYGKSIVPFGGDYYFASVNELSKVDDEEPDSLDYEAYVNNINHRDLLGDYNNRELKLDNPRTKAEYGEDHWKISGINEQSNGRIAPPRVKKSFVDFKSCQKGLENIYGVTVIEDLHTEFGGKYTNNINQNFGRIFAVKGIASGEFQFDINLKIGEALKEKIKSEGVVFKIIKLSSELDPAEDGVSSAVKALQNLTISYVQEKINKNFIYPHSAVCGMRIDGRNFSSVPDRSYHTYLKKVLVPSNYNPDTKTYSGAWDGKFAKNAAISNEVNTLLDIDDSHKRWTDNPAWIYFDLISNPRFGLSKYAPTIDFVNKWQLYKIAKYCDEFVETNYPIETKTGNLQRFEFKPNSKNSGNMVIYVDDIYFEEDFGSGDMFRGKQVAFFLTKSGQRYIDQEESLLIHQRELIEVNVENKKITVSGPPLPINGSGDKAGYVIGGCCLQKNHKVIEPRFSCNVYINEKSEALDLINKLSSVFRSINSYLGGKIHPIQDTPQDPIQMFNNSNVLNGEFSYSTADKKRRITACVVQFVNQDKNYEVDSVYEEDSFAMQRFGFVQEEVIGFGVSSASQARRLAKWNLISSQTENEIIKFNCSQEGNYLYPNSVIEVYDETRTAAEKSGRIKSIGDSYIDDIEGSRIVINKPYIEIDKDISKEPSGTPIKIKLARGKSGYTYEDLENTVHINSSQDNVKDQASDQDAAISAFFNSQILSLKGVLRQVNSDEGVLNIVSDLIVEHRIGIDLDNNRIMCSSHNFSNNDKVTFSSDGLLPSGLGLKDRVYIVRDVNLNSFRVSEVVGGAPVNILNKGKESISLMSGGHFVHYHDQSDIDQDVTNEVNQVQNGAAYSLSDFETLTESSNIEFDVLNAFTSVEPMETKGWFSTPDIGDFFLGSANWIWSIRLNGWIFIADSSHEGYIWAWSAKFGWIWRDDGLDNRWYFYQKKSWGLFYFDSKGRWNGRMFIYDTGSGSVGDRYKLGEVSYYITYKINYGKFISESKEHSHEDSAPSLTSPPSDSLPDAPSRIASSVKSYRPLTSDESIQRKKAVLVELFSGHNFPVESTAEVVINDSSNENLNKRWEIIFKTQDSFELIDSQDIILSGQEVEVDYISTDINFKKLTDKYFKTQMYRVLSVKEQSNKTFEVIASEYNSSKYTAADSSGLIETPILPIPPQANMRVPNAPTQLSVIPAA